MIIRPKSSIYCAAFVVALAACDSHSAGPIVETTLENAIVFFHTDTATDIHGIHAAKPDGSELRKITGSPVLTISPAISPDGRSLAFTAEIEPFRREIFLINADGSGLRQLSNHGWTGHSSWSPNGDFLAFEAFDDEFRNPDLYVVEIASGAVTKISTDPVGARRLNQTPSWSPSGDQIVFAKDYQRLQWITPTGELVREAMYEGIVSDPDWCSDGRIAFTFQSEETGVNLALTDSTATSFVLLTNTPDVGEFDPAWSPDCQQLLFARSTSTTIDLYVMDAVPNATPREVISNSMHPDWQ